MGTDYGCLLPLSRKMKTVRDRLAGSSRNVDFKQHRHRQTDVGSIKVGCSNSRHEGESANYRLCLEELNSLISISPQGCGWLSS